MTVDNGRLRYSGLLLVTVGLLATAGAARAQQPGSAGALLLRGGTIIDPGSGTVVSNAAVLIRNGRIAAAGPLASVAAPGDARTMDVSGRFIIPGIIDAHIHIGSDDPRLGIAVFLPWGVTTVLNAGQWDSIATYKRLATSSDTTPVPRYFSVGSPFTAKGGWGDFGPATHVPASAAEARAEVRAARAGGADAIKVIYDDMSWATSHAMPMLRRDLLAAIVAEAHRLGLRVLVHAPLLDRAKEALRAGADALAHGVISGRVDQEFLRLMQRNRAYYIVTFAQFEAGGNRAAWIRRLREFDQHHRVPAAVFDSLVTPKAEAGFRARWDRKGSVAAQLPILRANLRRVAKAGIPIVIGTDAFVPPLVAGLSAQLELVMHEEAGLAPMAVLRAATANGAAFLGRERELGAVRSGYLADLLVLGADPLMTVANVRSIVWVVRGGGVYAPADLPASEADGKGVRRTGGRADRRSGGQAVRR
jgi:imidazolonepropionase-like amidohydrolase